MAVPQSPHNLLGTMHHPSIHSRHSRTNQTGRRIGNARLKSKRAVCRYRVLRPAVDEWPFGGHENSPTPSRSRTSEEISRQWVVPNGRQLLECCGKDRKPDAEFVPVQPPDKRQIVYTFLTLFATHLYQIHQRERVSWWCSLEDGSHLGHIHLKATLGDGTRFHGMEADPNNLVGNENGGFITRS